MTEYIDREKVKDEILSWAVCINNPNMLSRDDTLHCIDAIPAADVATVVRCRNCVYKSQIGKSVLFCTIFERNMTPDDFCSMGDRMNGMNEV